MRPFLFDPRATPQSRFLAGGTTLVDLMKLDVEQPTHIYDINHQDELSHIEVSDGGLKLGAMVRMAEAAEHPDIQRLYPVLAQSLMLAASPQIRNMASLGGNVLQRTRCTYFRDTSYTQCNKRIPGSGCAALDGVNRQHAILGTSNDCISTYPGDFAQALIALDAEVETSQRSFPFAQLHLGPDRPEVETQLQPGEMIRFYTVPAGDFRRSIYLKIRDRDSYQFALASAAVVLQRDGTKVTDARIALGGVAYKPWRTKEAEAMLKDQELSEDLAVRVADTAFAGAQPRGQNAFKLELGRRTLVRALLQADSMEI